MNKQVINDYAKLIVEFAVNVSEGQTVVINSPVECADFARAIADLAYQRKAKEVEIKYSDSQFEKIRQINTDIDVLTDIPQWKVDSSEYYAKRNATFISIAYPNPDLFKDVDANKMGEFQKANSIAFKGFMEKIMGGDCPWVVVAYPSLPWAKKVFTELDDNTALQKLWEAVLAATRLDQADPVQAWENHKKNIDQKKKFLNERQFKQLVFRNELGTDLTIGMPENHIWVGVTSETPDGFEYIPNVPTEEIFCMPHKYQVNGTLVSSMPLSYGGKLIEDFEFEFKDGKIINYSAKSGEEVLDNIIKIDDGAEYLGEVALVPYDSPISQMNLMFFNTLFDENASCHFAIGRAYPDCIENGTKLSSEEMEKLGVNFSLTHVDFMIGTADLSIIGIDKNGNEVQIFKDGNWAF